jgi:hypothetical protein
MGNLLKASLNQIIGKLEENIISEIEQVLKNIELLKKIPGYMLVTLFHLLNFLNNPKRFYLMFKIVINV